MLYLLNLLLICFSVLLICSHKPGITILFFILIVVIFSSWLFFLSLEFFAFSLLYIYIGGIMVLFIFFIMMIGDFYPMNYVKRSIPMSKLGNTPSSTKVLLFIFLLCFLLSSVVTYQHFEIHQNIPSYCDYINNIAAQTDLLIIGTLLFNLFFFELILISFILLLAMIGPINLLLFKISSLKRQATFIQLNKNPLRDLTLRV